MDASQPFEERRTGEEVVLLPRGDLDLTDLPAFSARMQELIGDGVRRVTVDLAQVTLLPSSAVGFLIQAATRLREAGGRLVLSNASRRVRGTLATMGVADLFR